MLKNLLLNLQVFQYTLIGGVATLIDWGIFALGIKALGLHYQFALLLSWCFAATFHYIANKTITFRCTSKKIASQLVLYLFSCAISLLWNMLIMFLLVRAIPVSVILIRMITTVIMLLPNYWLHKNITFNKRLFENN